MQIYTQEADAEHSLKYPAILTDAEYEELEARPRYAKYVTTCPTCKSTQPVTEIGSYKWDKKVHECVVDFDNKCFQWKLFRMYELSNIPDRYQRLNWDDIGNSQADAKLMIDNYVRALPHAVDRGYGLYIYSKKTGTGKTFCGTHILKEAAKLDTKKTLHRGYFVTFGDLLDGYEDPWLEQKMKHTNILVVDDVLQPRTDKEKDYYPRALETVVRYRSSNDLPTIVTSNLTWEQFEEFYPRCYSVLSDCVELIELVGDFDYRVQTGVGRAANATIDKETPPIT